MTNKIAKSEFTKEWKNKTGTFYYHNVWLDDDTKSWNIGAKTKNPDFLAVGQMLNYEITDAKMRKIKRLKDFNTDPNKVDKKLPSTIRQSESTSLIRALDRVNEEDIVFFDIETAGWVKELPKEEDNPFRQAWLYKARYNNELNKKTGLEATPEEYYNQKAALYGVFAKVVTIVAGRITGDTLKTKTYVGKEKDLLGEFNDDLTRLTNDNGGIVLGGWKIKGFDIPFLMKRMIIHRIQPHLLLDVGHLKPWEQTTLDLADLWQSSGFYPDSMVSVAVALGLPSPKSNMDGSQVSEAFWDGRIDEIAEYCQKDVVTEANIYRKFVNKSPL